MDDARGAFRLPSKRFPGAAHREALRCRTGIVANAELAAIPDQRCNAIALHRVRDMF
jgi:hypothetical protein